MALILGKKALRNLRLAAGSSAMYYGEVWDTAPAQFAKLERHGLIEAEHPHNPVHKVRAVITEKGKAFLAELGQPVKKAKKPEYLQKPKVTGQEILDLWDDNEETMGEQAALAVACDMLGIELEDAYDIMAEDAA